MTKKKLYKKSIVLKKYLYICTQWFPSHIIGTKGIETNPYNEVEVRSNGFIGVIFLYINLCKKQYY